MSDQNSTSFVHGNKNIFTQPQVLKSYRRIQSLIFNKSLDVHLRTATCLDYRSGAAKQH